MATVFISYRRSDSGPEAGRLADSLRAKRGRRFAFRDVVGLSPGERFDTALEHALSNAHTTLVLVGPRWLDELTARVGSAGPDYHIAEIAEALRRGKQVIPVLVRGGRLPSREEIPADIQDLVLYHSIELRDDTWSEDVDRLLAALERPFSLQAAAIRLTAACCVIPVLTWVALRFLNADEITIDFARVVILSILLAYLAIEGALWYRRYRRSEHRRISAGPARTGSL